VSRGCTILEGQTFKSLRSPLTEISFFQLHGVFSLRTATLIIHIVVVIFVVIVLLYSLYYEGDTSGLSPSPRTKRRRSAP